MLPFLQPKKTVSLLMQNKPEGGLKDMEPEADDSDAPVMSVAQDLMDAVHAKDVKGVANALKAAFDVLDIDEPEEDAE